MKLTQKQQTAFIKTVHNFYTHNKRSLPWRRTSCTPYHILVSEIMLQQTQVDRVIPKYKNFIKQFPSSTALSNARLADVLLAWQGLGYNRRAKMLHECAKAIVHNHNKHFPKNKQVLEKLPGIGPYTAAAIMVFAYNKPEIVIETNIRTVYIHHFFQDKQNIADDDLLPLIEQTMDTKNPREWYAALMDYGSFLKKTYGNATRQSTAYQKQSSFKGSLREARGAILRTLTQESKLSKTKLQTLSHITDKRFEKALEQLIHEGLVVKKQQHYQLP